MSFRNMERGIAGRGALERMEEHLNVGLSLSLPYSYTRCLSVCKVMYLPYVWRGGYLWWQAVAEGSRDLVMDEALAAKIGPLTLPYVL
jgi:hypothetical protein